MAAIAIPGNDGVAQTALAAAGVQLVLFTTGRGTPLGGLVPTVKIATNAELAAAKPHWIDFDASAALTEGVAEAGRQLLEKVINVAGGELTAAERNGNREIAIWKRGVTL